MRGEAWAGRWEVRKGEGGASGSVQGGRFDNEVGHRACTERTRNM